MAPFGVAMTQLYAGDRYAAVTGGGNAVGWPGGLTRPTAKSPAQGGQGGAKRAQLDSSCRLKARSTSHTAAKTAISSEPPVNNQWR